ncbi:MAG: FMN-binding negative transcriptional regulator [Yoonia sp.]|nr:FMN-binding negative transcriptional regulator [Yoonia sp.]
MYLPAHFEETDQETIRDLISAFPLATLVAQTPDGLVANHIPLMMNRDGTLVGHIAAANPMHQLITPDQDVLVIFQGADAYVSPNWYPTKLETHQQVPTWNYEVVHVHGRILFQHDAKAKIAAVGQLTKEFETRTNGADGWRLADAPQDYLKARLADIVAFKMQINRIVAKSKLNQNKAPQDIDNVAKMLSLHGAERMASRMKLRNSDD